MTFRFLILGVAVWALFLSTNGAAQGDILDFNELNNEPVPQGYGGFTWGNAFFATSLPPVPAGMETYVAFTSSTIYVSRGGSDFFFDGADFWSRRGADANGSFYFYLMLDGNVVLDGRTDSANRKRFDGTPNTIDSSYVGPIDYLAIVFQQGGDDWDHLALDNFRFHVAAIPEPSGGIALAVLFGLLISKVRVNAVGRRTGLSAI